MKIEGIEGKEINHLLLKHGDFFLFPTSLLFTAAFTNRTLTRSSTSICCPAKELPKSTHFFFFKLVTEVGRANFSGTAAFCLFLQLKHQPMKSKH